MSLPKKLCLILLFSVLSLLIKPTKIFATEPISPWSPEPLLPYSIASHVSFIDNNKLNIIAGSTHSTNPNISQSEINADGTLSSWIISGNLPSSIYWHSISRKGNFIYILGGATYPPSTAVNAIFKGEVNSGSIQNWTMTSPLPQPLSLGNSVVVGNKIYYSGGTTDPANFSSVSSKVYMGDINSLDGSIDNWRETTPLPEGIFAHGMVETGSKIIIVGGRTSFWYSSSKVYEAIINPTDGTLGNWTQTHQLPQPISSAGVTKVGDVIFIIGGQSLLGTGNASNRDNVYYAKINNSGSIEQWVESSKILPKPTCCGSLVASNTHLYYTGGYNSNYTNEVWMAEIQTATPTPTPPPSLNVPDIKQYTPPWNSQIYDTATTWSTNPTIQRWGCALTSAAMVLQYYNHLINPDTLNTWLNSQSDGYLRNGLLNWLAISRYTRQHDSLNSPTLEYRRLTGNPTVLISELQAGRPGILQEPGHFVVAKSITPTSFGINDPGYSDKPTLSSYFNSFESIGSFKPSHTDLSYIYLVIDPTINMSVFDPNGIKLEGFSFITQPLTDDIDNLSTSGTPLNTFLYQTPSAGKYKIEITGPLSSYNIDAYLYDKDGNINQKSFNGLISTSQKDIYEVIIGNSPTTKPIITFTSLLEDIENAWQQRKITRLQMYQLLKLEVQLAQKMFNKKNILATKTLLSVTKLHIKLLTPTYINITISSILETNNQILIDSI